MARALIAALNLGVASAVLAAASTASAAESTALAAEPAKRSFKLPAGDAEKALKVFSEQARLEVLYPTDLVSGVRTRSVSGDLLPREALTLMLAGTGLVAVHDARSGAFSLQRQSGPTSDPKNVEADRTRAGRPIGPAEITQSAPAGNGVVELSPFVVDAATDRGYQALNTLSGTRLNTKLEDLGSSITVVTKQQMEDTAVLDLNDVFLYEANTEGTGNFTDFSTNRNGGVVDNIQNSPAQANRIRGVGRANIAVGGFAVNPRIPLDTYNVDGVEISRGPNSNIFGLGGSAGSVNYIPIRANATRSISQVTFRADSYGGVRGTLDFNRPLLAQKLALRVAAVEEAKGFVRKPSSEKINRLQGLLLFKPFANTTIRASAESYDNFARRANSLTPRETVTGWAEAGKPTWDPTTRIVTLANGTKSGPFRVNQDGTLPFGLISQNYSRNSVFIDYATPDQLMSVNRTGNLPASRIPTPTISNTDLRFLEGSSQLERQQAALFPLYILPTTTDKALYNWSKINYMSPNTYTDRAKTFTVEAEQIVLNTPQHLLAARAAWFGQDFKSTRRNKIDNTESTLRVDVNEKMLDGSPNPYFLRPYFGSSAPVSNYSPEKRDLQSADLAYQWTPAKLPRGLGWIGQQKLGLHGETSRIDFSGFRWRDVIQSDHAWSNKTNRSAVGVWIYDKFYVGDNQGQNIDHAPATRPVDGQHTLRWFNALTNQWVSESVDVGERFFNANVFNNSRTEVRTLNATVQNYFFKDRLVTTFGWRNDRQRVRQSLAPAIDPTTGWFQNEPLKTKLPWISNEGTTLTQGAVLKPTRWLNLFYNQSDSFTPSGISYDALGELLPNPKGKGKDYGVGISLLNDRLHLKINRYETDDQGARGGDLDTVVGRAWTLDGRGTNGIADTATDFLTFSQVTIDQRFVKQGITPTVAQRNAAVAQYMGLTEEFLAGIQSWDRGTTADVTSHGYEFEVIYNPIRNWRLKFTAARQVAIDSNIGDGLQRYIAARLPVWTTAKDENGVVWWNRSIGGGATPRQTYEGNILAPIKLATATNGKPRSQVREWRWNAVTNYDFTEGRLRNFSVGGALRWQDKGGIGFLASAPDPDGVVRELDANKPVYDKARLAVDFSASYRLRLFKDRVRAKVQLNVRNVQENGRLQPVGVNPDGAAFAYRIIDPRQFILSTTFDL